MRTTHVLAWVVIAGLPGPVATLALAAPVPGEPMLVFLPPGADPDAILSRAGAREVAPGRAPLAVLATSDRPDAAAALVAAGAWAVRAAGPLSFLCTGPT
jgi:hypothetical protein